MLPWFVGSSFLLHFHHSPQEPACHQRLNVSALNVLPTDRFHISSTRAKEFFLLHFVSVLRPRRHSHHSWSPLRMLVSVFLFLGCSNFALLDRITLPLFHYLWVSYFLSNLMKLPLESRYPLFCPCLVLCARWLYSDPLR